MLLEANLRNVAGLTDVGYRLYNAAGAEVSTRSQVGVIDRGDGFYSVDVPLDTLVSLGAAEVRWDSTSISKAKARGVLEEAIRIEKICAKTDLITAGQVTIVSPVSARGTELKLVRGDDYYAAEGRALQFSSNDWPDLTGATVQLKLGDLAKDATLTAPRALYVELSQTDMLLLTANHYDFQLQAVLAGTSHAATIADGHAYVSRRL